MNGAASNKPLSPTEQASLISLLAKGLQRRSSCAQSNATTREKDLDTRIADWKQRIESERSQIAKERQQLAQERVAHEQRVNALQQSTGQLEVTFEEVNRLNEEVRERLAVTPMNLDAAALQAEWKHLDDERVALAKASRALEAAMDKLADAHAALETAT